MRKMKTNRKFTRIFPFLLSLVVLLGIVFWSPWGVVAEDTQVNVTITGDQLRFDAIPDDIGFSEIKLTGGEDTKSANLTDLVVIDARGTGAGWHVSVSGTQLTSEVSDTIDKGSLTMSMPSVISPKFGTGQEPTAVVTVPFAIDEGEIINIVEATTDHGLGTWNINWEPDALKLEINPANTKAGTYTGAITWTLNQTPIIE